MASDLDDILSGDYEEGVSGYEEIGAAAPRPGTPGRTRQVSTTQRRVPLGVDSGVDIAAGATADIEIRPQLHFRPERLVVAGGIAGSFSIVDIRVGTDSMMPSATAVPAEIFVPGAEDVDLTLRTCNPGQSIVVTVRNTSGAAARFRAGFLGTALAR
jgi:hypothetical protein